MQALEEAPPSCKLPTACINVGSFAPAEGAAPAARHRNEYTLRLGEGVAACMAGSSAQGRLLAGSSTGALWALQLVRGGTGAVAAAEAAAAAAGGGAEVVDGLVLGVEEFSDDEYEFSEDEGEDQGEEDE